MENLTTVGKKKTFTSFLPFFLSFSLFLLFLLSILPFFLHTFLPAFMIMGVGGRCFFVVVVCFCFFGGKAQNSLGLTVNVCIFISTKQQSTMTVIYAPSAFCFIPHSTSVQAVCIAQGKIVYNSLITSKSSCVPPTDSKDNFFFNGH